MNPGFMPLRFYAEIAKTHSVAFIMEKWEWVFLGGGVFFVFLGFFCYSQVFIVRPFLNSLSLVVITKNISFHINLMIWV